MQSERATQLLAGQKNYADAEPLLIESCQGLQQRQTSMPLISTPRAGSRNPSNGWCNSKRAGANPPKPPSGKMKLAAFQQADRVSDNKSKTP